MGSAKSRALAVTVGAVVAGPPPAVAAPAQAAQSCTGAADSGLRPSIDQVAPGRSHVRVGIGVRMLCQAQGSVDDVGDPFTAWIRGDDGRLIENLLPLPLSALGVSPESGLSADSDRIVPASALTEDVGTDEVRARVVSTGTGTGTGTVVRRFVSHRLTGNCSEIGSIVNGFLTTAGDPR